MVNDEPCGAKICWTDQDSLANHISLRRMLLEDAMELDPDLHERTDAFVVFHPGMGTNKTYEWELAFSLMRGTGKPMLLTAHNQADFLRDNAWWKLKFQESLVYKANP